MGHLRTLLTYAVALGFDLRQGLIDFWQVRVRRLHKTVLRDSAGIAPPEKK